MPNGTENWNGEKLAATREDFARFQGAVTTEIKGLHQANRQTSSKLDQILEKVEGFGQRLQAVENRDAIEDAQAASSLRRADRKRSLWEDWRSWFGVAISLSFLAVDILRFH